MVDDSNSKSLGKKKLKIDTLTPEEALRFAMQVPIVASTKKGKKKVTSKKSRKKKA